MRGPVSFTEYREVSNKYGLWAQRRLTMKQHISMTSGLTIGLDLGDRRSDVCVLDPEGKVLARFKVATTQRGL